MYSTYNEGKPLVAERFIRTLKNKILKHMATVSKNAGIDVLNGVVNKQNNTVHRTTRMKLIDVTSDFHDENNEDSDEKDPKFKVGYRVEYQNAETFLLNGTLKFGQQKFLLLVKLKIHFYGLMLLVT